MNHSNSLKLENTLEEKMSKARKIILINAKTEECIWCKEIIEVDQTALCIDKYHGEYMNLVCQKCIKAAVTLMGIETLKKKAVVEKSNPQKTDDKIEKKDDILEKVRKQHDKARKLIVKMLKDELYMIDCISYKGRAMSFEAMMNILEMDMNNDDETLEVKLSDLKLFCDFKVY